MKVLTPNSFLVKCVDNEEVLKRTHIWQIKKYIPRHSDALDLNGDENS